MGDTLPETLHTIDLRARYNGDQISASTFLQDAGRAFGYVHPHTLLLLSKTAFDVFCHPGDVKPDSEMAKRLRPDSALQPCRLLDEEQVDLSYLADDPNYLFSTECAFTAQAGHYYKNITEAALEQHVCNNRMILTAEPQSGKTGAFLWALRECILHFGGKFVIPVPFDWVKQGELWARGSAAEFFSHVQRVPDLLARYHLSYDLARKAWKETHLSRTITSLEMVPDGCKVADMGSGPHCHLATALKHLEVTSFDALSMDKPQYQCVNLCNIPSKHDNQYGYCVYNLSLWDELMLPEAYRVLKSGGKLLIHQTFTDMQLLLSKDLEQQETIAAAWKALLKRYNFTRVQVKEICVRKHNDQQPIAIWVVTAVKK